MTNINADAGTDAMRDALTDAAGDLEAMSNENIALVGEFESEGWSGLDALENAKNEIDAIRDVLVDIAEKIGVGGQIVRDAHLNNPMIGHASKRSLTGA